MVVITLSTYNPIYAAHQEYIAPPQVKISILMRLRMVWGKQI